MDIQNIKFTKHKNYLLPLKWNYYTKYNIFKTVKQLCKGIFFVLCKRNGSKYQLSEVMYVGANQPPLDKNTCDALATK